MAQGKVNIAIFTGNSKTGLATIRALLAKYADRVHIRAGLHSDKDATKVRSVLRTDEDEIITNVDANNRESLAKLFKGTQKAFIAPPGTIDRDELVNKVLDAAKAAGVTHVVIISSYDPHRLQNTLFGRQMLNIERHARQIGINYTMLGCALFSQNYLNDPYLKNMGRLAYPAGNRKWFTADIDDVGRVAAEILVNSDEHINKVYPVGNQALSGAEQAAILSKILGKTISYDPVSREQAKSNLVNIGWPEWQAEGVMELYDDIRAGNWENAPNTIQEITGTVSSFEDFVQRNKAALL